MTSVPTCNVADMAAAARPHGLALAEMVERTMQKAGRNAVERLYVGSNFCSQYFLRQPAAVWREAFALCRSERIPATLVVPIVSQRDLTDAQALIDALFDDYGDVIDEITVNDLGALTHCLARYGRPLNMGRLFFKAPRDPRYAHLFEKRQAVGVPPLVTALFRNGEVAGVELDPTHAVLDLSCLRGLAENLAVGVHMPYCYQSTGAICEYASINRPVSLKFRPNAPCALECTRCALGYELPYGARLVKWGRTVFFPNHDCTVCEGEDFRMIVSPFDVLVPRRDSCLCHGPTSVSFRSPEAHAKVKGAALGEGASSGARAEGAAARSSFARRASVAKEGLR